MVQAVWPAAQGDGAVVTEARWGAMATLWQREGVVRNPGADLYVTATGTGLGLSVTAGAAWVQAAYYRNTTAVGLTPAAADPSNPRLDWVVVRVDWLANSGALTVVPGLPGVAPVPPALARTPALRYDCPLALVRVPAAAGTLTSSDVTDARVFADEDGVPPGACLPCAGSTVPAGYLPCAGQSVSRVTYSRLFAVLGTAYGAGDGSTTFTLPDLRGRVPVGLEDLGFGAAGRLGAATLAASGGSATRTGSVSGLPAHAHSAAPNVLTGNVTHPGPLHGDHAHSWDAYAAATGAPADSHTHTVTATGASGPGTPHHHPFPQADTFVNLPGAGSPVGATPAITADESAHTHSVSVSGAAAAAGASHGHLVALGGRATGGISVNHAHPFTWSGTTGATGGGAAQDTTQPWLATRWVIRY